MFVFRAFAQIFRVWWRLKSTQLSFSPRGVKSFQNVLQLCPFLGKNEKKNQDADLSGREGRKKKCSLTISHEKQQGKKPIGKVKCLTQTDNLQPHHATRLRGTLISVLVNFRPLWNSQKESNLRALCKMSQKSLRNLSTFEQHFFFLFFGKFITDYSEATVVN